MQLAGDMDTFPHAIVLRLTLSRKINKICGKIGYILCNVLHSVFVSARNIIEQFDS